jgi:hypothetical protein
MRIYTVSFHWGWFCMHIYVVSFHWGPFCMCMYVVFFHWGSLCMRMHAVSIGIYIYGIGFRSSMFMCISVAFYYVKSCPSMFQGVNR